MKDAAQRVIVLGLDGASFDILLPLIKENKLPHLAWVMKEGVWGELRSTIPPYSAQAWASMATGVNQGKHGIVDFWRVSKGNVRHGVVDSTLIRSDALWGILSRHGKRVGVVNVPLTYPPLEVKGYMVSGFMTPRGKTDYTYPPDLREEILEATGEYDPDPYDPISPSKRLLEEYLYWMRRKEEANRFLLSRYPGDFFISVVQALDQIQHFFWSVLDEHHPFHDPSQAKRYQGMIEECYRLVDDVVGQRLGLLDEKTSLFIISDHGFGPAHKWFQVNKFLSELGLLVLKKEPPLKYLIRRVGLTPQNMRSMVHRSDVFGLRRRIGRWLRMGLSKRMETTLALPINWEKTAAYSGSPTSEGIYINLKGRDSEGIVEPGREYERVRDLIMDELLRFKDPETSEPVVDKVYRKEEIYGGPYLLLLPDIVFSTGSSPYMPRDDVSATKVVERIPPRGYVEGRHTLPGIFMAIGSTIGKGTITGAKIVDIAPTILYAMGLPVPRDMDGKVLEDSFCEEYGGARPIRYEDRESTLREREEASVYTDEETREIEERLRGLGYWG
ncbi:MAG: alkaline phosphatase family protein [Anaerolineae bacterium]